MTLIAPGSIINVTVASGLFDVSMIGRQVWKKYLSDGSGGGRARIQSIISSTVAQCKVLSGFDNTNAVAAANWYFTTDELTGLNYLEGETVGVIADGGVHRDVVISNGTAKLDYQVSTAFIGYKYRGTIISLNLDQGGQSGSAQAKPRNVWQVVINMIASLGFKFGTTLYDLEEIPFRTTSNYMDRPPPVEFGNKRIIYGDSHNQMDKRVVIIQDEPLPCNIASIDVYMETTDETQ